MTKTAQQKPRDDSRWRAGSITFETERNIMKMIHPLTLEAMLEASQPVEILDIRPRAEFEKVHIEGAHSIPSAEISAETLVCTRELLQTEPLYLVSESGALAQLQACDLERQGLDNVIIVSGGMLRWQSDGLPVVRRRPVTDWLAEQRERVCAAWHGKDEAETVLNYVT
jgi:rhodanese-related sulfurtransferase